MSVRDPGANENACNNREQSTRNAWRENQRLLKGLRSDYRKEPRHDKEDDRHVGND